jgi:hypothetical protein
MQIDALPLLVRHTYRAALIHGLDFRLEPEKLLDRPWPRRQTRVTPTRSE